MSGFAIIKSPEMIFFNAEHPGETMVTGIKVLLFQCLNFFPDVLKIVKDLALKILGQDFGESGRMKISLPVRHKEKLMSRLNLMQAVGKKIKWHS